MSFILDIDLRDVPTDKRIEIYRAIARQYPTESMTLAEIYFMRRYSAFVSSYGSRYTFTDREKYTEWALTWL